jgi:hypothetical protein
MTALRWWGSRRTVREHVVTVVMQEGIVVDVQVDESPAVEIRRLAGRMDG